MNLFGSILRGIIAFLKAFAVALFRQGLSADFDFESEGQLEKGVTTVVLFDFQQGVATFNPKRRNAKGQVVNIPPERIQQDSIFWTGPSFVALTPDPANKLRCFVVAIGIGRGELSCSVDGDPGDGVVTLSKKIPIIVNPAVADDASEITEGEITDQLAAGPDPNPPPPPPVEPPVEPPAPPVEPPPVEPPPPPPVEPPAPPVEPPAPIEPPAVPPDGPPPVPPNTGENSGGGQ